MNALGIFLMVVALGLMAHTSNFFPDRSHRRNPHEAGAETDARGRPRKDHLADDIQLARINRYIFLGGWTMFGLGLALVAVDAVMAAL